MPPPFHDAPFMAILGRRNSLPILRAAKPGLILDGGEHGEILLPRRYIPTELPADNLLEVFVYRDSEDRPVATTETPLAMVGEFALLRVLSTRPDLGAFLDWGLAKDLLLPRREQANPVRPGELVVARVYLDEKSDRIVATTKLNRWLKGPAPRYTPEQEVQLLVIGETPLGYNAIVENTHLGLLYRSELSAPLAPGDTPRGFVKAVRPDGKVDLSLDRSGYQRVKPLAEQILDALSQAGGTLPFHDKSSPEEIRDAFGVSKKAFKQALGTLFRQRKITLEPTEIRLLPGR